MPLMLAKLASAIGIRGFIAIGFAVALALVMWRADVLSGKLDDARFEIATERANHAITRGSVALLEKTIADMNAEALARAEAFEDSRRLAADEAERLKRAARASQGQIDRLRALAAQEGSCAVPEGFAEMLEGL